MKLGSLFDGIGGWPLAAVKMHVEPVWASEIEAFPITVTEKHFPGMKQLGDITAINGADIEPVNIICMGSPCQDLSVAGKREGLAGARSGLFMDAVRIVREMREATNGKYPRFVVWENVPGAFSSNKGNDFRAVLEEITESNIPMPESGRWAKAGMVRSNGCEVAWRTLDAQYWGVPQRRKRIFLVADFRCQCAAEILFKPEGVSGNIAESGSKRESITGSTTSGTGTTVYESHPQDSRVTGPLDISPTVSVKWRKGAADTPLVCRNTAAGGSKRERIAGSAQNSAGAPDDNQVPVAREPIPINDKATRYKGGGDTRKNDGAGNGLGVGSPGDPMPTMTAGDRHAIAYTMQAFGLYKDCGVASSLKQRDYKDATDLAVETGYRVRRLTPTECERLQGFPDGYTLIDNKRCSDSARYKALGNGMAQPCADFVIRQIVQMVSNNS